MKIKITTVEIWTAHLQDRPGAMATKLDALAKAGAYLQYVHARRTPEIYGKGLLSVWPVKGAKQVKAATEAGFSKTQGPVVLRLECPDRAGLGAQVCHALSLAGINVRSFTGIDVNKVGESYLVLDNARDAAKAQKVLKAIK